MAIITQDESLFTTVRLIGQSVRLNKHYLQTTDYTKIIFDNEGWILDRYDVTTGQNPLPFFDRVSFVVSFYFVTFNT